MKKVCLLLWLVILTISPVPGQAQELHRAGLVVQFPDGRIETACVAFSENEITGADLLSRSGLATTLDFSSGLGAKVCKIGGTGCDYPGENCWCHCQGSPCTYWNYWLLRDGQWAYSPLGASSRRLGDGDVDGWTWGDGQPPPNISLAEVCRAEAGAQNATALTFASPLETPAARPTTVPTSQPTATSPASPLPSPTAIAQPTDSPTATPVKVFAPATSGQPPTPKPPGADLPPSSDRYAGFAGVLAALGLIALAIWRRRKGV